MTAAGAALLATAALAGCASEPSDDDGPVTLTLVTHESFSLGEGVLESFTEETGIAVELYAAGDAGELVNQIVLTKDDPLGDVVFGVDNTFASRAVNGGALADYVSPAAEEGSPNLMLPAGGGGDTLTPITSGDVCVNVDHAWFEEAGIPEPQTLDDLVDPTYAGLFVTPAANSSSPGLAFLLATIEAYGDDGWQQYWRDLVANDVIITAGWSDAYYTEFSGPSSEGDTPIVLSYASSPPFEVSDGTAPTGALLDTCFRQSEYAGVLAGTEHEAEAQQLIDFLYSVPAQESIPEAMFVYPANPEAALPTAWAEFAEMPTEPFEMDPARIDENREAWISEWAEIAVP